MTGVPQSVESRGGAPAVGRGSSSLPAVFAVSRCLSLFHSNVSSPSLSELGVPISGTGLSSGIMRLAHKTAGPTRWERCRIGPIIATEIVRRPLSRPFRSGEASTVNGGGIVPHSEQPDAQGAAAQ